MTVLAARLVLSCIIAQRAGRPHPGSARLVPAPGWLFVGLFRLEAGFLDHPLPAYEVLLDEAGEPLGLAADRVHPLADQLGAYVRLLQDAVDLGAELGHDRRRRTGWRENAVPALD